MSNITKKQNPAWLSAAQKAMDEALTSDVWQKMLSAQVEKAKKGDGKALKLLADLAGLTAMQNATFIQENHYHGDDESSNGDGISPEQWERNRQRHAAHLSSRLEGV